MVDRALGGPALAALLWPAPVDGVLGGAPLDGVAEAILIGLAAPILWWLHPDFLRTRLARTLIVSLVIAKALSMPLAGEGWCVQFDTPRPLVAGYQGRIHSWDVRADWRGLAAVFGDPDAAVPRLQGFPGVVLQSATGRQQPASARGRIAHVLVSAVLSLDCGRAAHGLRRRQHRRILVGRRVPGRSLRGTCCR